MKYFTKALLRKINSDDLRVVKAAHKAWERNLTSYRHQLEELRSRLSAKTYRFFSRVSLHDGSLLHWSLGDGVNLSLSESWGFKQQGRAPKANVRVISYGRDVMYELQYSGIRFAQLSYPSQEPYQLSDETAIDRWLYDELTAVGNGLLKHEAFFMSGATMCIVFKTFNYRRYLS